MSYRAIHYYHIGVYISFDNHSSGLKLNNIVYTLFAIINRPDHWTIVYIWHAVLETINHTAIFRLNSDTNEIYIYNYILILIIQHVLCNI